MIAAVIRASLSNRLLVILAALMMAGWGWWAVQRAPLDALPDLSDVQVIIKASYPGKAPQVIEDQVTWPLTTSMLSVPGAKTVRGFSMFGDAYVYVLFEDGTVFTGRDPGAGIFKPGTGAVSARREGVAGAGCAERGWIYEYALIDRSGKHSWQICGPFRMDA
ncbi:MAG: efflux RND transporter permease subunit [Enterobacter hormaechei]